MTNKITWTRFPNQSAMRMDVFQHTLEELVEFIKNQETSDSKEACPWIKMATFGNIRTGKNSLRHNQNLLQITGVEGDYDGEMIGVEKAIERLEQAGIKAIVYTSPSYTDEKPRWRVICPASKSLPAHTRSHLLARVNGALKGILSSESFTLSQSYYFGPVRGVKYRVLETFDNIDEGHFIDDLDELDEIAVYKTPSNHKDDDGNEVDYSIQMFEIAFKQLGRKLKTGDKRRELLKSYIASRSGKGLLRDELLFMIEGVINRYFDPKDSVDADNIGQIINAYAQKDSGNADQPADISMFMASSEPAKVSKSSSKKTSFDYPEPFGGPMRQIVESATVCAFKPQPELNMLAAIIGMASCVNGEYSMQSGGRFNLFGIGSLESGGGKDNPRTVAESIAGMGGASILGKPSSGAGIEDALEPRKSALITIDEMSHFLKAMNDERAPAHIVDIGSTMLKLWSNSKSAYTKRTLAKGPHIKHHDRPNVPNPCVSIIGFSTPSGFGDAFHEQNLRDGLIGRLIYVPGRKDVEPRRVRVGFSIPKQIESIITSIKPVDTFACVGPIAGIGNIVLSESSEAERLFDALLVDCERSRDKSLEVSSSLYARSYEKIERVAGVLAIWDDPVTPIIKADHVLWARDLVFASDAHILDFVSTNMHTNEVSRNASKLKGFMVRILNKEFAPQRTIEFDCAKDGNCIARSQLLRVSKMNKKDFDLALMQLQELGDLESFGANGKPLPVIRNLDFKA